jgi:hypothetical protein
MIEERAERAIHDLNRIRTEDRDLLKHATREIEGIREIARGADQLQRAFELEAREKIQQQMTADAEKKKTSRKRASK